MKTLTRQQLESRKAQAVRFTRDVLGDDDLADEIKGESLDDYAERKRIRLANPTKGVRKMPAPTRRELQERIQELETQNEDLQSRIDEIADLVAPDEDETDDETEEE